MVVMVYAGGRLPTFDSFWRLEQHKGGNVSLHYNSPDYDIPEIWRCYKDTVGLVLIAMIY